MSCDNIINIGLLFYALTDKAMSRDVFPGRLINTKINGNNNYVSLVKIRMLKHTFRIFGKPIRKIFKK